MSDQLRMQAQIGDGFSGPLAKLRSDLRQTNNTLVGFRGTHRGMTNDWKATEKSISGVTSSIKTGLMPVLRGVGITSLSVGSGLTAAVLGLRNFASSTRSLNLFSRQIDVSVGKLRELKVLGEHFGMSWDQTQGSLKTFAGNMDQLRRHWGEAYNQLRGMNLADLAEQLASAPNMATALERAIDGIKRIQNPVRRRQVAEILLGSDQWAVIAAEATPKLRSEIRKILGALPKGSDDAAEAFANNMLKIRQSLEQLRNEGLGPLLPEFNRFIDLLAKPASDGSGAVFLELMRQLGGALKDVNDAIAWLQKNWPKRGEVGGLPEKGSLGEALGKGMVGGAVAGAAIGSIVPGAGTGSGAAVGAFVGGAWEGGRYLWPKIAEELQKLRKALEDANKNGSLLQQQSYQGGGFGGARIWNASLGGAGGGFRRGAGGGSGGGAAAAPPMGDAGPSDGVGAGLKGHEYLRARRAGMKADIDKDPQLKKQLAGMMALEGERDPVPVMESLANRTEYMNEERRKRGLPPLSLRQMLFSGFYGPINRGQLPGAIRGLERNPARMKRLMDAIDAVMGGSNIIKGATDQGMPTDPNGRWPGGRIYRHGNVYNDWGGGYGHDAARRFREAQQRALREGGLPMAGVPMPRSAPPEIRGNAVLDINFNGLPAGSKIRHSADGMFREVNIRRGRPMQSVWDA